MNIPFDEIKDFDENLELRDQTIDLVNEMLEDDQLTDTEKKVAQSIIQQLTLPFEKKIHTRINIDALLHPPEVTFLSFHV